MTLLLMILYLGGSIFDTGIKKRDAINLTFIIVPVIVYSLIEGLRYGRGNDYLEYKFLYENALSVFNYNDENYEFLFTWLNYILRDINIPYYGAFIVYSFLTIFFIVLGLRKLNVSGICKYALPLFLIATLFQSENIVRQTISFSICFAAICYLIKGSKISFFALFIIALGFHNSAIIVFIVTLLLMLARYKLPPLNVVIIVYLISWIVGRSVLPRFSQIFTVIPLPVKYERFTYNTDFWFSGEELVTQFSTVTMARSILNSIGILVLAYYLLKKYNRQDLYVFLNLFIVGAVFNQFTIGVQLLTRITTLFYNFQFIVFAIILYYFFRYEKFRKNWRTLLVVIVCINQLYNYFVPIINSASGAMFVWDL